MRKDLSISNGRVFLITDIYGNINPRHVQGYFFDDVRHLSYIQTLINGEFLDLLNAQVVDYNRATIVKTNKESYYLPKDSLTVIHDRIVDNGLFESTKFINNTNQKLSFVYEIRIEVDFTDMFKLRDKFYFGNQKAVKARDIYSQVYEDKNCIIFTFKREEYYRETYIELSEKFRIKGNSLFFEINIEPKATYELSMRFSTKNQNNEILSPDANIYTFSGERKISNAEDIFPKLYTNWDDLKNLYEQSIHNLSILKIELKSNGESIYYTAAGLPWFMTLYGRDAAITAYQMLGFDNRFAIGVLKTLSKYQGKVIDSENEEEPGKIVHEMRYGEVAHFKDWVKFPYYGTIDATLLYLKLFVGLYKFHAGDPFFLTVKDNILASVEWIEKYGDIDNDGFVEYHKKSERGLRNQNWRDSDESMMFSSGELAETPIASADVQGYVYDVKKSLAEIARTEWGDDKLAEKLLKEADDLKVKFNKSFWVSDGEYFALGLDKDKRLIDTPSSSMGHLLWSEIVDDDKKEKIVKHLMSDGLYSGWGIRTITKESKSYNPLGYHLGTVWPHDNSLIVRGLYKSGFYDEAGRVIADMIEASKYFDSSLPELFAGYGKEESPFPVSYPTACDPQAWASGAVLQFLKVLLGIEMHYDRKTISINPLKVLDDKFLRLEGFEIFGKKYNITADRGTVDLKVVK